MPNAINYESVYVTYSLFKLGYAFYRVNGYANSELQLPVTDYNFVEKHDLRARTI